MKTVLIVDDEAFVREELNERIDWKKYGYERVIEADNGSRGLECFKREVPDLVFTDIRMPVMDGITFCSELKKLNQHVKIVVLSSYMDFEYVRQAFKLGVVDYLPKHQMEDHHVSALFQRLAEEDKGENQTVHLLGKRVHLRHWLMNPQASESSASPKELYIPPLSSKLVLLQIRVDDYSWRRQASPVWRNPREIEKQIVQMVNKAALEFKVEMTDVNEDILLMVCAFPEASTHSFLYSHMCSFSHNMQALMSDQLGIHVSILYSPSSVSGKELPAAFEKIRLESKRIHHKKEIRSIDQVNKPLVLQEVRPDSIEALRGFISDGEVEKVKQILQVLWLEQAPFMEDRQIGICFRKLLRELYRIYQENTSMQEEYTDLTLVSLEHFTTFEGLFEWSFSVAAKLLDEVAKTAGSRVKNRKIREILDYLHANPEEDLGLNAIAEKFHFNKSYLSEMFKLKVGTTYTRYMTNIRMELAKQWLETSDLSIQEISERIGFNDAAYFIKTFRIYMGMSPEKFRKSIHK